MRKRTDNDKQEVEHRRALKARTMWKENREKALALDNHACRLCLFTVCIEVHHIVPVAEGGTDAVANLITLCPNHHAMVHRNLIPRDELRKAQARRKSTLKSRLAEGAELFEYVGRASVALDSADPVEKGRVLATLEKEVRERLSLIYGAKAVDDEIKANPDIFRVPTKKT